MGDFSIETLAVLDLFNTDREYVTEIITKGIDTFLELEEYADKKEYYLGNYQTENMKPFFEDILRGVIGEKLKKRE